MKTKEELNALKNEVETLGAKLAALTEDELALVTGGGRQNDPLYVVDGIVIPGGGPSDLKKLDETEPLNILKDARPEAIYGSLGTN